MAQIGSELFEMVRYKLDFTKPAFPLQYFRFDNEDIIDSLAMLDFDETELIKLRQLGLMEHKLDHTAEDYAEAVIFCPPYRSMAQSIKRASANVKIRIFIEFMEMCDKTIFNCFVCFKSGDNCKCDYNLTFNL